LTGKGAGSAGRPEIIDHRLINHQSNFRHKKSTDSAANAMIPSGNYTYVNRAAEPFRHSFS
jgi:hypothetical protein